LLFDLLVGDGCVDPLSILVLDELHKAFSFRLEFALGDKLSEVYSPTQSLQTGDIACCSTAIILLGFASVCSAKLAARFGQHLLDILLLDAIVHIDGVVMEDPRVFQRLKNWPLKDLWEEWVFVWRIIAAN
jgi:hypothetical protein